MKFTTLLPLAALGNAFVLPDGAMTEALAAQSVDEPQNLLDKAHDFFAPAAETIQQTIQNYASAGKATLDDALAAVSSAAPVEKFLCHTSMIAYDAQSWLESAVDSLPLGEQSGHDDGDHHGKRPPHHRRPPHDHKPNLTVYELIAKSKYTTHLAKLINEYDDLVELLNGTTANFTVFAPTDKAFENLPKGHKKPSKEVIKAVLQYHVSPHFYPAGRVLASHTIPTAYEEKALGGEPQRLRVGLSLKGLVVNFYARIVAVNIFATNGVIHGVDHLILPPPSALKIISLVPGEFSTLELALTKTGLDKAISESVHTGGTFFAPSNFAFKKLGARANAFLFSSYGEKYLKALLKYHIVANQTLYSDAFYSSSSADATGRIPRGVFHADLTTLLDGKTLGIDVARYGGFINIRINGYNDVRVQDGLAKDGVIQVPGSVIIPPKSPAGGAAAVDSYSGGEISVAELKERLGGFVEEDDVEEL